MTIKKSLISVAASAAIIAAVTGCSSDSSTPVDNTGVQSAVKAVDGYVYNALVKAYYVKEDNTTMGSVTLTATQTLNDTSTNPATVAVGSSTYSLSAADDANASIKNRIKFFTLANDAVNAGIAKSATSFAPASYIESDGIKGYDINDTLVGTTVLYAPANSGMITPITSLVYHAAAAQLGTTTTAGTDKGDANTTIFTALEANATKIATNLGLSGVNLLTADAVELEATNPTFSLVNALLKDGSNTAATATSILAATPATSLAATIANVATALPAGNGKTFAQDLQTRAENGSFKTTDIATLNVEKSVADGQYTTLAAPAIKGKIAVNGITIGGVDSATLSSSTALGAKWKVADTVDMNMSLSATDTNVSNTTFNLYVVIDGDRSSMDADSNISSAIVAKIPFDLNLTDGKPETAGVAATSLIAMEARSKNGDQIINPTDINASDMGISGTTYISADSTDEDISFDINGIVGKLVIAADANLSTNTSVSLMSSISRVQVLLEDASGKLIAIEDTNRGSAFATANLTDLGISKITATEAIKLLDSTTLDMRADNTASTGANSAQPITSFGTAVYDATITETNTTGTVSVGEIINVNLDSNTSAVYADFNLSSTITVADRGADEKNTKTTATVTDTNVSGFVKLTAAPDSNGTANINLSLDTYPTVTSGATGHPTSIVSFTTTDEFGKASNAGDYNLTFQLNRPGTIDSNVTGLLVAHSAAATAKMGIYYAAGGMNDVNLTYASQTDTNGTDGNLTSVKFTVTDPDGQADMTADRNITWVAGACTGMTVSLNGATGNGDVISLRGSTTTDNNETNLSFRNAGSGVFYANIDANGSHVVAAGSDCNFTIETYDAYNLTGTDYNLTINLSN